MILGLSSMFVILDVSLKICYVVCPVMAKPWLDQGRGMGVRFCRPGWLWEDNRRDRGQITSHTHVDPFGVGGFLHQRLVFSMMFEALDIETLRTPTYSE